MEQSTLEQLNKEKESAQSQRAGYIKQKLIFITSLFGLGSINISNVSFYEIFYIIPLISCGFDFYILVEDFKIKRIGEFIKIQNNSMTEWELWVSKNKNPYAAWIAPAFTILTFAGSSLFLAKNVNQSQKSEVIVGIIWGTIIATIISINLFLSNNTRNFFLTSKNMKPTFYKAIIYIATPLTLILTILIFIFFCDESSIHSSLGQLGDFYGGIFGTIITFISIILIYNTYITQKNQLDISKKDSDLIILTTLHSELLKDIDSLQFRKKSKNPADNDKIYNGIDALFNFDSEYQYNPNSILNHLNSILVSFENLILMINKTKYKYSNMKDITLSKAYFTFYSKIIWPVYQNIYRKHREELLNGQQPNAKSIFDRYEKLTKDTYQYLLEKKYVEEPTEIEILKIINSRQDINNN